MSENKLIVEYHLNKLKEKDDDFDYNIDVGMDEYIDYIKLGKTPKEKLQIFMMLYVVHISVKELNSWTLGELINYIRDTDEYYEEDREVINICINEVNKKEEII